MKISAQLDALKNRLGNVGGTNPPHGVVTETGRGRDAERPGKIPVHGWLDILWRAWREISEANLFLVAGGVTYALLLALFPALAAFVAIYGLALDPAGVEQQINALSGVLPE